MVYCNNFARPSSIHTTSHDYFLDSLQLRIRKKRQSESLQFVVFILQPLGSHRMWYSVLLVMLVLQVAAENVTTTQDVIAVIHDTSKQVAPEEVKVCTNKACVIASKRFRKNMNKAVDPCDNFYQFACGNFVKNQRIPKSQLSTSTLQRVGNKLIRKLLPLLKNGPDNLRAYKMAKHMYSTCMDLESIDARGIGMFLKLLKDAGGWPVLEGRHWNWNTSNWVETTFKLQQQFLSGDLIDVSIMTDQRNSVRRILLIDQLNLELDRIYLIEGRENKRFQAYANYMRDVAVLFGAKPISARKEMNYVLNFEIKLAKITLKPEDQRDPASLYNTMQIETLQSKHNIVDWKLYLKRSTDNEITFGSNDNVTVAAPAYLDELHKLLKHTSKRTITNYQFWVAVRSKVRLLTKAFRDRWFKYYQEISGAKKDTPRWKLCLATVQSRFQLAIGSMYVRQLFDKDSKRIVTELVEKIRLEMLNVLKHISWMDKKTRAKAIEKAKAIAMHIAYPDEFLDNKNIEEYYKKLDIMEDPFFESMIKFDKFRLKNQLASYHEVINRTDWRDHGDVATVNAFYAPSDNSVRIPAAILQDVIFSPRRPKYMNYATIGFAVGHEITHGFDDMGRHYDKQGDLVDWWAPKTNEKFRERMQCVIQEANNFTDNQVNLRLNGITTQGENVADLGAAKLAMAAYRKWADTLETPEPRLVGFEQYSQRQMFWITVANFWCTKINDFALRNLILTNEHPPSEYRVINVLRNHETFAEDFNCPRGSPMNPTEKCNVW